MDLEHISNDNEQFVYTEGHVSLADFLVEVREYGHLGAKEPRHAWLVEKPVPEELKDEFSYWYGFCESDTPRAFPVTVATC